MLRHSGVATRHEQAAVGERAELLRFGAGAAEVRTDARPHSVAHASGPACTPPGALNRLRCAGDAVANSRLREMRAVLARALTGVLDERGVECSYIVIADASGDLRVEHDLASRRQEREAVLHLVFQIPTAQSGRGAESSVETELPALVPKQKPAR